MSKAARKTESLSYPSNPLAAIRELQDLDSPAKVVQAVEESRASPSEPVVLQQSSEVANATSSQQTNATSSQHRNKPARARSSATGGHASPVEEAVLEVLAQPYTQDLEKGPFTVTTVKIPTEVWERLGWVASLTGQSKQRIITEALKEHFQKVSRGR